VNVSELFIRRPIATSLLALAIMLAGITAYFFLPVAPLPQVDMPTIQVQASLPGASPETMASSVATPLERRFGRIAGISEITSSSSLGSTSITLQFDLERDVDAAARDVQAAINAAGGELPANLPTRPTYRKVNPADSPILILSANSDTLPLPVVFDVANSVIAQKISQIEGVGQVTVGGGQQPAVRVQVDPAALAGIGMSLEDVRAALSATTVNSPKGAVNGAAQATTFSANDQLFNAEAYRNIIINYQGGAAVRLGDVANVVDDVENNRVAGWINNKRSVVLIVRRQPGANIIETIDRVVNILPVLQSSISPAINISIGLDRAQTIRASVHDVEFTLVLSVALVVMVVFMFLRNWRATVIPSVAVPLSLLATFGVMYLLGYSLDNLSLMALTISTGFVVDDAIVVTENVTRFVEEGEPPFEAALKGARQIGFTIISITVSLLAVFIPILLMGGIIGRLFREFAVTLSIAIAVSAVVSLTLTPMMCSRLLRSETGEEHGRLYQLSERFFEGMVGTYARGLRWVLGHRWFTLGGVFATIGLTIGLVIVIPIDIFPQQDTGMMMATTDAPQDTSFPAMKARQEQVNELIKSDPDVSHMISFIQGGNTGTCFIELSSDEKRAKADQIIARLRPRLAKIPGMQTRLQAVQDLRTGGRPTRTQYQYALEDADINELRTWAPKMEEVLGKLPELKDVATDLQVAGLQVDVALDRDMASRLGILPQNIDDTLYDAFGQRQVATNFTQTNQYRVVLEMKPELAQSPDAIEQLYVRSATGAQVPIRMITKISPSMTALSLTHQSQFPAVTLSFNLAPRVALGQALDAIKRAENKMGLPSGIHASAQGTAQQFEASKKTMPILGLSALFAVYIVLGVLYESAIHPITIISTLPPAGVGALLALMLFRMNFTIIAMIGIILLIGIVKKNAIMMIDFAIEVERDEGLSPRDAIYKACLLRFRPITMTTMAALLGGIPLAVGTGVGSELRQPLGIAIVGGLIVSQMLTLFTTPVIYLLLDRFSRDKTIPPPSSRALPDMPYR
jgi:hydrophobe/amphiphile efflux-1 (HAE1) family protein